MLRNLSFLFSLLLINTRLLALTAPGIDDNTNNYLGTFWQGQTTFLLSDNSAASTLVEVGAKNYRFSETLGFSDSCQKNWFKIGVEYLKQDIDYTFYSGVTRKWVNQVALGLAYQYVPDIYQFGHFDISGFYSHAPSHVLPILTGNFALENNIINYINNRRIAGSNAGGANAGATLYIWQGLELGLALNYDNVNYNMNFEPGNSAKGVGGTVGFTQYYGDTFKINGLTEFRAPFDSYQFGVTCLMPTSIGEFSLGVNGGYINGKHQLPNTKAIAFTLALRIDPCNPRAITPPCLPSLTQWTAKPAVYIPQVLAIKDERIFIFTSESTSLIS